jgi:adenylosuccinate synthase
MAQAILVVGLSFGDEGKGATTDALARHHKAHTVVRFNGGAQAAHNVCAYGTHHTFRQFGSGTLMGARTHLSRHVLVNPFTLAREATALEEIGVRKPFEGLTIDGRALLTTPFHIAANCLRELARGARHGSCGMGIGETVAYAEKHPHAALRAIDLGDLVGLRQRLEETQTRLHAELRQFWGDRPRLSDAHHWAMLQDPGAPAACADNWYALARRLRVVGPDYLGEILREGTTIFEGAQGVLLDQTYGFFPHVTRSNTTFDNAIDLLAEVGFAGESRRIGVLRSYASRHGAGPFPTEDPSFPYEEAHNGVGEWQGGFRTGHFDMPLAKYAIEACGGVDELSITHIDRLRQGSKVCEYYAGPGLTFPLKVEDRPTLRSQEVLGQSLALYNRHYYGTSSPVEFLPFVEAGLGVKATVLGKGSDSSRHYSVLEKDRA